MRHRSPFALALSGAVLVSALAAGALVSMPGARASSDPRPSGVDPTRSPAPVATPRTCYSQLDHDAFGYALSQNFDPEYDLYDAQAADDFVLKKPCRRPVLFIDGTYGQGEGVADSFNVTIYRAGRHGPGQVVRQLWDLPYTEPCGVGWGCTEIILKGKLRPGHWWLSVQANIDLSQQFEIWRWWTNLTVRHTEAMWQNPPDGLHTGCTTYTDLLTCFGDDSGLGGDLSFSISATPRGTDEGGAP